MINTYLELAYFTSRNILGMDAYHRLKAHVLSELSQHLSPQLTYHGLHHVLDVLNVCIKYIRREKISKKEAYLLKAGALLHDIGFLHTYEKHEEMGVVMAYELMNTYMFCKEDIKVVEGLIMATKVPQQPKNELEKILCDADLDYLGRDDFTTISESLFQELQYFGKIQSRDEWNRMQVKFLVSHQYHTPYARKNRQPQKEQRLTEIKVLIH